MRRVDGELLALILGWVCTEPGVWPVSLGNCSPVLLGEFQRAVARLQGEFYVSRRQVLASRA